jgi:hypothetical protein
MFMALTIGFNHYVNYKSAYGLIYNDIMSTILRVTENITSNKQVIYQYAKNIRSYCEQLNNTYS